MPLPFPSQSYMEISRGALAENARAVVSAVGVPVIGVVKCDGYGMKLSEAAAAWKSAGVKTFAVSDPAEAYELRKCGFYAEDILLLTPVCDAETLRVMLDLGVTLTVTDYDCAAFYAAHRGGKRVRAHVAVDTGMGRFGTAWNDISGLLSVYSVAGIAYEGIFSHFSASFEGEYKLTKTQLERFLKTVDALTEQGVAVGIRHIANSCAALRFPETQLDAVRVGSALTGRTSAPVPIKLHRVGVFRAAVVEKKILRKGDTTGYASVCRVKKDTPVAVVAIGHVSGFGLTKPEDNFRIHDLFASVYHSVRDYPKQACVYFNGKPLPVLGRAGSQYTIIDATGSDIGVGDFVTADVDVLQCKSERRYV